MAILHILFKLTYINHNVYLNRWSTSLIADQSQYNQKVLSIIMELSYIRLLFHKTDHLAILHHMLTYQIDKISCHDPTFYCASTVPYTFLHLDIKKYQSHASSHSIYTLYICFPVDIFKLPNLLED